MRKSTLINVTQCALGALAILFANALLIGCGEAPKEDNRSPEAKGEELFISYCQICHGEHGDGSMADLLKVQPPDLTLISARRGGNFPDEVIAKIIDGREPVPGHGTLDMPIWGQTFRNSEHVKSEKEVQATIGYLVAYLKTIQQQ